LGLIAGRPGNLFAQVSPSKNKRFTFSDPGGFAGIFALLEYFF
jgi:hypothetical protein